MPTRLQLRLLPQKAGLIAGLCLLGALAGPECLLAAEPLHPLESLKRIRAETYVTREGAELLADVYQPPGDGPFPTVLMVHGGAWAAGSRWHMLLHANRFAQHGYTVVAINYRLAPKHKFPAQLEDCRAALDWMRTNAAKYRIDAARIGAFGYSAGGHLVALLGVTEAQKPDASIRAIVAGGAPCNFDWIGRESRGLAYFLGGSRKERPEAYRQASPVTFVSPKAPPFFFFHGQKDQLVPVSSSQSLHQSLQKAGVESSYHLVGDKGHLMTFHDKNSIGRAIEFMDRHLKQDGKPMAASPGQATESSKSEQSKLPEAGSKPSR